MLHLLKIEWLKIKSYKAFIIILSFFCVGILASNYMVYSVFSNLSTNQDTQIVVQQFNPFEFSGVWQTVSYISGYLLILPAILLIVLVTNEFTYKTSRQNIIDGLSRAQFIGVKILLAFLLALLSVLLVIATGLFFGFRSGTSFEWTKFSYVGYFFLKALSYNLIAVLMAVMIRRTGFAIGVYFIYMGAENIIAQLLDVWSLKLKNVNNIDLGSMGDYLPMSASDGLLAFPNNPFKEIAKSVMPTEYFGVTLIMVFFYIILASGLSIRSVVKRDL